jgi:hypothetical protein
MLTVSNLATYINFWAARASDFRVRWVELLLLYRTEGSILAREIRGVHVLFVAGVNYAQK